MNGEAIMKERLILRCVRATTAVRRPAGVPHGPARRAVGRVFLGCLVAVGLLVTLVQPAGATDAFPGTDDHSTTTATGRWWYYGQTEQQVNDLVRENNARLTQVRVESGSGPTFAVTMVANTGDYASAWWWYYGKTADQVNALLSQNDARLISIDPYWTGGGLRFAVVMVPNSGSQQRGWWWYYGQTPDQIKALLDQNHARLVALRPYTQGPQRVFAVIMVSNTGPDYKPSQWWVGSSIGAISGHLTGDNMRVTALAPDPLGGWDAILVASEGEEWYWWYGLDPKTVEENVVSHGSRLIDLSSYVVDGTRKYAAVELGDDNPSQPPVNAESSRIQSYADTNGWGGGYHGVYFISSAPGTAPVVAANSGFRYEPASAIKVLYLLYTLRQGVSLNSPITYYWTDSNTPNPNACPADIGETPANARQTTIGNALTGMIQSSNNVYTRAFALRWGLGPVQAMAAGLGMASTHLNQPYIGCGFRGGVRNQLTLADAARLYAAVDNGTALPSSMRALFFAILVGAGRPAADAWGQVVTQEAASLGKSAIVPQFLAQLSVRWKAGSYTFCMTDDGSCTPDKQDLSLTGWMSIPFIRDGRLASQNYEFGDFVNDLYVPCGNCAAATNAGDLLQGVAAEAARTTIRQALMTWR
jgi:Beta-lactamase enzyme family/Bacterial tandem repeat domain 1